MQQKTAKFIEIRRMFRIPKEGFATEREASDWYRAHYKVAKGTDFAGSFGFRYVFPGHSQLEFDYRVSPEGFFIAYPHPLDNAIPFDREVSALAKEVRLPEWKAPALRLVVLMGGPFDNEVPYIASWLIAPIGQFRLLFHPASTMSLRQWRRMGEFVGVLPSKPDLWQVPGITQGYGDQKWGKKGESYWETQMAYMEVVGIRRQQGRKGKRGILQDTAKRLEEEYGWEYAPDSYTIRRYLDRAQKIWHMTMP